MSMSDNSTKSRYHELKCHPDPFQALEDQIKTFEYRYADRDFKINDTLILREYDPLTAYSGRYLLRKVVYIIKGGFGIPSGYCIMSIRPLTLKEDIEHSAGITEQCRDNPALSA
jgi:hypothetical protein